MGILDQSQLQPMPTQGQPQPAPQRPAQGMPMKGEEKPFNAQDSFDKFVIEAMKIIHTPRVTDKLIAQLKASSDTVEALGLIALNIVERLESSASEKGFPIKANTIINGLNVIVGELVNVAVAAGAKPLSAEQKYQAFSWAFAKYLDNAVKSGKITPEEMQAAVQKIKQEQGGGQPAQQMKPQGGM